MPQWAAVPHGGQPPSHCPKIALGGGLRGVSLELAGVETGTAGTGGYGSAAHHGTWGGWAGA